MGAVAPPKQARTRQQHLQVLLGTRGYAVCRRCLRAVESPPVLCRWMVFAVRTSVSRHWWWSSTDPAPSTYLPGSVTPVSPGVTKPYGGGSEAGGMGWPRHLGLFPDCPRDVSRKFSASLRLRISAGIGATRAAAKRREPGERRSGLDIGTAIRA